ncbi:Zn-dependent exopeptidase M28 [Erwinia sp. OLTSP20]|uniref:M28 family metallopeptidase n=1 Tax=unclassified Erwinia TaxID=2622719 RepID=UPI000C1998F8|nr:MULTISPECIES: M28 family metallopeptidase [unclassified Erwinia]PIJ48443.1 Zn-dependent exopeptidase M28 [Erwinia sp. OAMSP11]PIJ65974.1 Zn-dependent exopeptidase M28 [Erwinia sp. OLSSP12]PIJ78599.1 Zn-dependent exopeptidase M28 [Erwinia sp. OLCASP19]PIJ79073.1 Zn-dependent exopeptidase M28 [Erwinia sp. OLMTSP26]PIJ80966.1 Zn-dependent exopeptidase M28 [Erwinia sp. OLMDSP33]
MQHTELRNQMQALLVHFQHLHRLSGSADAELAVDWLIAQLQQAGLKPQRLRCELLLSDPGMASLTLSDFPHWQPAVKIRSFAGDCPQGVQAPLYHDVDSLQHLSERERTRWQKSVRGRIVIADQGFEDYVQHLNAAGAAGLIHIWGSAELALHEETVGPIWGTPVPDDEVRYPGLPVVTVNQADGQQLLKYYQQKTGLQAHLRTRLHNHVASCSLPIVDIPGKEQEFVLLSSHYDSWHQGVTDNATGNALCLAIAQWAISQHKGLRRGLRIAWWPGHSNARYGGSAWYADRYRESLQQHCVAHINVDSPGCQDAIQILVNTSGAESVDFLNQTVRKVSGSAIRRLVPLGKGADQSFWGCGIPLHFALREQPEIKTSQSPGSGGGWWWHTEEDTLDKVDMDILWRDTCIHIGWLSHLLNEQNLPLDPAAYLHQLQNELKKLQNDLDEAFDLTAIALKLRQTHQRLLQGKITEKARRTAVGFWHRARYSSCDDFHYDLSWHGGAFPGLQQLAGHRRPDTSPAFFLMLTTQYYRQRDRILSLLESALRSLDID